MKTVNETRQELLLKERRVIYWERFHAIPTIKDLVNLSTEVLI